MTTIEVTKERPIIYSDSMVRAMLNGYKTQTRRILKQQPTHEGKLWMLNGAGWSDSLDRIQPVPGHSLYYACPYGVPGDRLWVRETLEARKDTTIDAGETMPIAAYSADGSHLWTKDRFRQPWQWKNRKLPSIHMPRWACRLVLEITDVRIERLNSISDADAIDEGIECKGQGPDGKNRWNVYGLERLGQVTSDPKWSFERLWNAMHGSDAWTANPWVWVISFRRIES